MNRIAVLGEALVDVFPGEEVIGGAPFNVARNLAALGEPPLMLTRIGEDARGERVAAEFARYGMPTAGLQRDARRPTGVVQVLMDEATREHRFEIGADCAWDAFDGAAMVSAVQAARPKFIYFGTLAQRSAASRKAVRASLSAAAADGAVCFLDLNLRDDPQSEQLAAESLALSDVVKLNAEELEQVRHWWGWGPERLAQQHKLQYLLVTRGARGWSCFDAGSKRWLEGPAPVVEDIVDTVGAGDAFAAVTLLSLAHGWPLNLGLQRAAAFAARVCMQRGAVDAASGLYAETRAGWIGA